MASGSEVSGAALRLHGSELNGEAAPISACPWWSLDVWRDVSYGDGGADPEKNHPIDLGDFSWHLIVVWTLGFRWSSSLENWDLIWMRMDESDETWHFLVFSGNTEEWIERNDWNLSGSGFFTGVLLYKMWQMISEKTRRGNWRGRTPDVGIYVKYIF